jgi:hypothetical protein
VGLHGEGIAGLAVSVAPDGPERAEDVSAETRTLADGTFDVLGLEAGLYRVSASGAGVVTSEVHRVAAPATRVVVVVSRAVAISGLVTDWGVPAPGATLEVSGSTLDAPRQAVAGPDGRFQVDGLPEGRFVVAARRGARAAADTDVGRRGLGPWPDVTLALASAATLAVRVAGDAGPVAGAWVVLAREELLRRAVTDAAGVARFEGVLPGNTSLVVVAEGFLAPPRRALAVDGGAELGVSVVLERGISAFGRVVDRSGAPIAGAVVELRGEAGTISAVGRIQRLAWASGKSLAPSRHLVPVGELGVLPGPIPLLPPRGALVAAPDDGTPEPAGFRTAADGTFRIANVPPGRFLVRAVHRDFAEAESELLAAGIPVTVVLLRGGDIFGRVSDDRGVPLLGAELSLIQAGRTIAVAFVDREARYRFAHVLGDVTVRAAARGYATVEKAAHPDEGGAVDLPLSLPAAADAAGPATDPGGGTLRGVVRDAVTRGALVAFTIAAEGPGGAILRRSFEKGDFAFSSLRAGPWKLTVEARGFATRVYRFDVQAGGVLDDLGLELQVGATLAGTVYDEHGWAVAGATVQSGVVSAVTDRLGGFKLRGVDPGDVAVVATHPSAGSAEIIVPLRSGDELLTLEIRLSR